MWLHATDGRNTESSTSDVWVLIVQVQSSQSPNPMDFDFLQGVNQGHLGPDYFQNSMCVPPPSLFAKNDPHLPTVLVLSAPHPAWAGETSSHARPRKAGRGRLQQRGCSRVFFARSGAIGDTNTHRAGQGPVFAEDDHR